MALANSPTNAPIRLLHDEASHGIAFTGRTLVVHWRTETRVEAVQRLATLLSGLAAEPGSLTLLQVIGDRATPPDGAARAALAAMLKEHEARIVASAVVFEGSGFRASVIRSIVIGISMLSRPKCPHTVFASVSEGLAWLTERSGADPRDEAVTRSAIDRLRQH